MRTAPLECEVAQGDEFIARTLDVDASDFEATTAMEYGILSGNFPWLEPKFHADATA